MSDTASTGLIVFGEALLDDFPDRQVVGGAPLNVARATASLGCAPLMITRIGHDANALLVRDEMQRFGLDQSGVQTDAVHPTGVVQVHVAADAHRFEIMPEQAYDYIDGAQAVLAAERYMTGRQGAQQGAQQGTQRLALVYYGTLAQRNTTSQETLIRLLSASHGIHYLDLNLRDGQYSFDTIATSLLHADILKVNEDELQLLLQTYRPGAARLSVSLTDQNTVDAFFAALKYLQLLFKLSAVIVTLGARGYMYLNAQGVSLNGWQAESQLHPVAPEVVDTVGCGDAFSAVFLAGLMHAWPIDVTLQRAHAFAASVCTIRGAVSTDLNFYRDWQSDWGLHDNAETSAGQR